jgi:hypothetical protein
LSALFTEKRGERGTRDARQKTKETRHDKKHSQTGVTRRLYDENTTGCKTKAKTGERVSRHLIPTAGPAFGPFGRAIAHEGEADAQAGDGLI